MPVSTDNPHSAIATPQCAATRSLLRCRAAVVSLIHTDNEAKLLPDVQQMLGSFEVVPAAVP